MNLFDEYPDEAMPAEPDFDEWLDRDPPMTDQIRALTWRADQTELAILGKPRATDNEIDRSERQVGKNRARAGGDLTPWQWRRLLMAHWSRCAYCKQKRRFLAMDHVVPVCRGGKTELANVVPACRECNSAKRGRPPEEWLDAVSLAAFRYRQRVALEAIQKSPP